VRRPGLVIEVMYDPEKYDGRAIHEAVIEDLAEWLAERDLFGGFRRITYDEQGDVIGGQCDKCGQPKVEAKP
jgi:hypothetical protein